MKNRVSGINKSLLISMIVAVIVLFFAGILKPLYVDVDNFTISLVTDGLYDKENFCLYLHPFLCYIIKAVSVVFPMADAYLLLIHFLVWFEIGWLIYLAWNSPRGIIYRLACFSLVLFSSITLNLFSANFTVQAASFAFTGFLTFFMVDYDSLSKIFYLIIGLLFIVFGFMLRIEAALIFVPFVVMDVLVSLFDYKKEKVKNVMLRFCVIILVVGGLIITQDLVMKSAKYIDAINYNTARTTIEDYPLRDWEEIKGKVGNIDELDYEAAKNWFYMDTVRLNSDNLNLMAIAGSTTRYPFNLSGVGTALIIMVKFVLSQTKALWVVLILLCICLLCVITSDIATIRKIECVFAVLGGITIILYFTILGRVFLRVWYAVIYAIFFVITLQMNRITNDKNASGLHRLCLVMIAIISLLSAVAFSLHQGFVRPNTALSAKAEQNDVLQNKTCNGDDFYFWGEWFDKVAGFYMNSGKLPTEEFLNHNADIGSWVYGQNYFNNNLADAGISNPMNALLERKNTYYVADDCQFILQYMHKFYSTDIEAVKVDAIDGTPIWQFRHEVTN